MNITTEEADVPGAVLIRGVKVEEQGKIINLNGPGKLTKYFHIDNLLRGHDVTKGEMMWIEGRKNTKRLKIEKTARIGIDYARHSRHWKWNFKIKE